MKFIGVYEVFDLSDDNKRKNTIRDEVRKNNNWKPQNGIKYYFISFSEDHKTSVVKKVWKSDTVDYMCYATGNCFRTHFLANKFKDVLRKTFISFYKNNNAINWGKVSNDE